MSLIVVGYAIIYVLVEEKLAGQAELGIGKWSTTFQLFTLARGSGNIATTPICSIPHVLHWLCRADRDGDSGVGLQYLYRGLIWLQNRAPSIAPPG